MSLFSEPRSSSNTLARVLSEVQGGTPLSRDAACRLLHCEDETLPALLAAARAAKERFKPGVVTYSRKVFLPLTNLCRDYCGYCVFRRDPGDPGAHTMTPDEVLEVVRQGEKLGCTEALFSLGDKPELLFPEMRETLRISGITPHCSYLEAMCDLVLRESTLLPHPNPGLLSAEWVRRLAAVSPSMGLMLETTNSDLLRRGAAHDNAPDKLPAKRLRTIEEAGKQRVPFTTGLLIGIGESSRRSSGYAACHPRSARPPRAHPGSDRSEFPRQSRTFRCSIGPNLPRGYASYGRGRPPADAGGKHSGTSQSFCSLL